MALNAVNIQKAAQQAFSLLRIGCFHCQSSPMGVRTVCRFRRLEPSERDPSLEDIPLLERPELGIYDHIYSLEDNTMYRPQGDMQVILKYDVEGLGMKCDVLTVTKRLARSALLPSGVAVYASPENLKANEEEKEALPERERRSIWAQKTIRTLGGMHLPIGMSGLNPWTLTKQHVRIAFRQVGVEMEEESIELPKEPITQFGPFTVYVTVNKKDRVEVSGTVYQLTEDERFRPTQEVWGHTKVEIVDAVITAMKENGLVRDPSLATL